jgi:predicted aminopeptidase
MMQSVPAFLSHFNLKFAKRVAILAALAFSISGCMVTYLIKSGTDEMKLLNRREPIEKALASPDVPESQKQKLRLAMEARKFAEEKLYFKPTKNYQTYVALKEPYVTWVVVAAPKNKVESYFWHFPLVGKMPYKGYFNVQGAKDEAKEMKEEGYDVWVRGVTAYSTLGWFEDPLLSSMLAGNDPDLVNLIIHESAHATLYIKNHADFNERLATFLGNKGTEEFYKTKEGDKSPTNERVKLENEDEKKFSEFITKEIKDLNEWYASRAGATIAEEERQARLKQINEHFVKELKPKMKTSIYDKFEKVEINNAYLASLQTYVYDLSDFGLLLDKFGGDFKAFIAYCKTLEKSKDPALEMKQSLNPHP